MNATGSQGETSFVARWGFPVILWGLPLVYSVSLKAGRSDNAFDSALALLTYLRPEVMLYCGLALLTHWSMTGLTSRLSVRLRAAGWAVLAGLFFLLDFMGNQFWRLTGSHLDGPVLRYAVEQVAGLFVVLSSEADTIPLLIGGWMALWIGMAAVAYHLHPGEYARRNWLVLAVGSVMLLAALPTPAAGRNAALGRPVVVQVATTMFDGQDLAVTRVDDPEAWTRGTLTRREEAPYDNVVVIWLESLGWDASSFGAKGLATTPYLQALAADSLLVEDAWSVVPHSTKSSVAIYCGVPPHLVTDVVDSKPGGLDVRCLPHLLNEQGFQTVMLRSATDTFEGWRGLIANMGFQTFVSSEDLDTEGFEEVNYFGFEDDILLPYAERWLTEHGQQPFFLTYMTGTAHHDYRTPGRYPWQDFPARSDDHAHYLNSVYYVDQFVKKVIDLHKRLGLYERTVFVLVGDHGEAFGEHGRFQHNQVPYEEVLNVPLIVHAPGRWHGERVQRHASHIDLQPTIVDLLGYDADLPARRGQSLLREPQERIEFMQCWFSRRCGAARQGPWKMVHFYGNRPTELYFLPDDPDERHDLAAAEPERAAVLLEAWYRWHAETTLRHGDADASAPP